MNSFRDAVTKHTRASAQLESEARQKSAAQKKAEKDTITRRLAPFQAAAVVLEALMESDPDFSKFVKKWVVAHDGYTYLARSIASTKFGTHSVHDGWIRDMTETFRSEDTKWELVLVLSRGGRVELRVYDTIRDDNDDKFHIRSPADVPEQVRRAFQPVLVTLQDRRRVYDFLLEKFNRH